MVSNTCSVSLSVTISEVHLCRGSGLIHEPGMWTQCRQVKVKKLLGIPCFLLCCLNFRFWKASGGINYSHVAYSGDKQSGNRDGGDGETGSGH